MLVDGSEVDHSAHHRTADELDARLDHIRAAPTDTGTLEMIVVRPEVAHREVPATAELSTTDGVVGDNWGSRPSRRTAGGSPHPDMQINVMSARAVEAVAGPRERWPLAGDQLLVDLDLTEANLPPGTRLQIGSAVIEITAEPHTGCDKFSRRFGTDARRFVNSTVGRELRLRGINAKVVQNGRLTVGDRVRKVSSAR